MNTDKGTETTKSEVEAAGSGAERDPEAGRTGAGTVRRHAAEPSRRSRPGWRRIAVAASVAVALAVGIVGAGALFGGSSPGASAEAASLLEQAAVQATGARDPVAGPGQYLKVITTAAWPSTAVLDDRSVTWLEKEVIEVWIPADPSQEWVQRRSGRIATRFFSPEDERRARAEGLITPPGRAEVLRAVHGTFYGPITPSWQTPTDAFLAELPRDSAQLLDRIYRDSEGHGPSKDGEAFVFVADLLRGGTVPADLRVALFRAAARIPGVEVIEALANLEGRTGVAVGRVEEGSGLRRDIIFDPQTGAFIGEREVALTDHAVPGVPAGTAISHTAVTTEIKDGAP